MSARLTILGSCGGWPERGRACSGFLVEYGGFVVVLDLGYGTLPRLLDLLSSSVAIRNARQAFAGETYAGTEGLVIELD